MIHVYSLQKHSFNFHFEECAQATFFSVGRLICSGLLESGIKPGLRQQPEWGNGPVVCRQGRPWEQQASSEAEQIPGFWDDENALSAILHLRYLSTSQSAQDTHVFI